MAMLFRWLMRLVVLMLVLVGITLGGIYFFASRSLPDYDKTLNVTGISAPVEIVRNNANVPHIFGTTDTDTFFGLGYVHAQDRLWQMIVLRRTAQGRLSELFGSATLPVDTLLRRLDIYRLSQQSVAAQDPAALAALEAYASGVNARLNEINRGALGRGAPEMFLFNAPIAPWRPADSIAVVKLMAVQNMHHLQREILLARATLSLRDPARVADILPTAPGNGLAALPDFAALFPDHGPPIRTAIPGPARPTHPLSPFRAPEMASASNAWAAAPSRSATGGTLLANDPHLGFSAPAIWYLARIELQSGGVIGGTIPGMPAVLTGRSKKLGWGLTSSYLDDIDLFMEELNPENPEEYRTPEGFKLFETRKTIIEVKDSSPVTLTLRWSDNGPILPPSHEKVGTVTPPGHVAALRWTALSGEDTSLSAAIGLMQSDTITHAIAAAEAYVAPSQNLILADRINIAMKTIGTMPRRAADHESQGRLPSRGWKTQNRWQGMAAYAAGPEFLAPKGGIVGNTNNKTVERPFPLHVSFDYGDTQRFNRWNELMQRRQVHTRDSFIEAQLDTVSYSARVLLSLIGAELWFTGTPAPDGTPERLRQRALELLVNWNGEMYEHLPEPLIYAAWMRALQRRLIQDELGPLAEEFTRVDPLFLERVFRDVDGAGKWCDVLQSNRVETCPEVAQTALDEALVWLSERYGTALESLQWGQAHQAAHDHAVLGEVPLLRYFVNIRQSTSGGDNTLNRGVGGGSAADPFLNVHGAGYRGVYDFADPDSSVFVVSTGQSGHFLSRHYDDMATLWRRGEYVPMSLDEGLARAAAVGITRLLPQ
ncbi:penicillin acylase family protein [Alisedimentitalea sp. MJ-SS2]|uniref:penicillin acylase family protein n=1 Tax=Aliisedimentitalea sp. MJ-SS2 TaxID=3049795 RepID=UPI002911E468|nr:penicillin acylase family protein [Alisedimentitalea sp. MJ-SS2]MDU8926882.1 penicillin acylase family protein [Alisedimentitalea sp. MJ-SS2]